MKYHIILFLLLLTYTGAAAQSPARTGKDYAVFFYVTDFQPGLKDLPDTQTEARDLAKELTDNYGFACSFVPECTKNQIQNELKTWNQRLKPGDQVLFFFSTHGYYDRDSDRGYLIPSDGHADDQNNYFTSWLSYDDLRTYLAPCKAGHLLVALDACYSGAFGIRSNRKPDDPAYNESVDCAAKIGQAMQYKGRQFITAGKVTEATPGKSAFAAEILKTLRTGFNEDGMVLIDDLAYRLHKLKSPEPEDGTFVGHQPGGDFVFVRKNACDSRPTAATDAAEEQTWKIAQKQGNGKIYLDEYPNGKYATQAKALKPAPTMDNSVTPHAPDDDVDPFGLIPVKGGTFTMGCTGEQKDCGDDEKPAHQVTLSDFYIGQYEVTQRQWQLVMGNNPSSFKNCDNCPVENVSWDDMQEFLKKLNAGLPTGQKPYRLPTEAEWEYTARGGGKAVLFGNGKNVADPKEINFDGDWNPTKYSIEGLDRKKTVPVGSLNSPNALGLHDMSGNVWEWCSDWYGSDYYKNSPSSNPTGPSSGSSRVLRGGSWYNVPQVCRVAGRSDGLPGYRDDSIGFRLARTK